MNITPCLWFNGNLAEAIEFYTELFPDSAPGSRSEHDGQLVSADWTMLGQGFRGINAESSFAFTEAISFSINCANQAEVDHYWNALTADGGEEGNCAWCKDKFGVSWQVVPEQLPALLSDPDPARAQAALQAMFTMRKIVVADLEAAADAASAR